MGYTVTASHNGTAATSSIALVIMETSVVLAADKDIASSTLITVGATTPQPGNMTTIHNGDAILSAINIASGGTGILPGSGYTKVSGSVASCIVEDKNVVQSSAGPINPLFDSSNQAVTGLCVGIAFPVVSGSWGILQNAAASQGATNTVSAGTGSGWGANAPTPGDGLIAALLYTVNGSVNPSTRSVSDNIGNGWREVFNDFGVISGTGYGVSFFLVPSSNVDERADGFSGRWVSV